MLNIKIKLLARFSKIYHKVKVHNLDFIFLINVYSYK